VHGRYSRTVTAPPCSIGATPVRPTEAIPPNRVAIVTGSGGGIGADPCDIVGLTSPEPLTASPMGTADARHQLMSAGLGRVISAVPSVADGLGYDVETALVDPD
jgi:hypothetical protein